MRTCRLAPLVLSLCACSSGGVMADLGADAQAAPADLAADLPTPAEDGAARDLTPPADLLLPAATGQALWGSGYANATVEDVAAAPDGSIYVTGSFTRADFGDGQVSASGTTDVFLVKHDKLGQRLWARTFGRAYIDAPNRVAVDKDGNAAVVGYSLRTADTGTHDAFVAVYSPAGAQRSLRYYGGALVTAVDTASSAAFAADGSLWVAGGFEDRIDLGGGTLVSQGSRDIFVLHLSAAGAHLVSRRFGFTAYDQASGLTVLPDGDVAVTGGAGYPIDFGDGNPGNDPMVDTFLVRLDPTGAARWSKRFRVSPFSSCSVTSGADGSVWFVGDQNRVVDFGGGPRMPATGRGVFWAHYAPTGAHLSSTVVPATGGIYLNHAAIDSTGQFVAGGRADGDIDFGFGLTTLASGQAFFFKAAESQVRWARRFGGTNGDEVAGVAVLPGDQLVAAAALSKAVSLDAVTIPAGASLVVVTP